jgi:peptide/nickel transport system permease protein
LVWGLLGSVVLAVLLTLWGRKQAMEPGWGAAWRYWWQGQGLVNWRLVWFSACVLVIVLCLVVSLSANYYVLGTDRTGNDIIWQALKSVRTALVIGTLTTFAMLPPAIILGLAAGYFRGWVDDVIQYIYTTLTSIPGVLLIAACVLMMQVYIDTHPDSFDTVAARADLRLFMLCLILGLTGWAGLCRLLRAEVLKLRELDYVQAAQAFGVGHLRIMFRHLLPNVMHIVLITLILEFSGLVLYEAVLSYLGIGVDPSMPSFGRMIDAARSELSRDPIIWWGLAGAFVMMLGLVLSANIFADAVQTAFDPRTRRFKALRVRRPGGAKV